MESTGQKEKGIPDNPVNPVEKYDRVRARSGSFTGLHDYQD
jgi:hypothetical protein